MMMKRGWLWFGIYLVVNLLFALVVAYITSVIIDARARSDIQIDSTMMSMRIAGIVAPCLLAPISGWQSWRPGPFYFAAACACGLFTGNIGFGVVLGGVATCFYLGGRKLREVAGFYFPKRGEASDVELEE